MTDTDAMVERILTRYDTITVVGASATATKAAHSVPAHMQRHGWRIIPVNPHADEILGEQVYRTLADVPEQGGAGRRVQAAVAGARHRPPGGRGRCHGSVAATGHRVGRGTCHRRGGRAALREDRCLVIEQRRLRLEAPGR